MYTTKWPLALYTYLQKAPMHEYLNKQQNIALHCITGPLNHRGLLFFYKMGSGKTRMAIAANENLPGSNAVLLNKSLTSNFIKEIEKYHEELDTRHIEHLSLDDYNFISLNASNVLKQINFSLEGKTLIIDEAHHLFNGITNMSPTYVGIYKKIMATKNIKLIFLTGTPLVKSPFELVPMVNMLTGAVTLPEDEELFETYFIEYNRLKNKDKLANRLFGVISHYDLEETEKAELYPELLPDIIENVQMSEYQYSKYIDIRDKEIHQTKYMKRTRKIGFGKKISGTTFRTESRQACNGFFPEGWMDDLLKYAPKFHFILKSLKANPHVKHAIYSDFIARGLEPMSQLLTREGITYRMIDGSTPFDERQNYIDEYNKIDNLHGEKIQVFLISKTGIEGLNFTAGRILHILEPYWHEARHKQLRARFVRLGSHLDLPEDERNVQVIFYLAGIIPDYNISGNLEIEDKTTDEYLYEEAIRRQYVIDEILEFLKEVSVDCMFHHRKNCMMCAPTGEPLYSSNIGIDLQMVNPCRPFQEKKVIAHEFLHEGKKYLYTGDIVIYDNELERYVPMAADHPLYPLLLKKAMKLFS